MRRYFRQVFRARPPKMVVQIIPDLRALAASCVAGLGLTVLPSYLCARQLREGTLVRLHEPTEIPANEIFLAWSRLGLQRPHVAFMRKRLLETAADW
nr:LysR substrate-binding domain-containing protein [Bradyrhizobium genosp. SA-3]